jgi:sigma-B regulation protein RsbU (phosphoserine phosphatase)
MMPQKPTARILIIDDEAAFLRSIVAYLEDSGFVAKGAENGKEGLEMFASYKPDLVLTDLHMPILGGLEVLHKITQQSPYTPVIVISGAGELSDAIEALRLGAWDYLTKPITDLQVLEHAVRKALERKNLQEENQLYAQRIEQNLKILEEDHAAGRRVQQTLLPIDQTQINAFEFKFRLIPSLELSGDFVEFFPITDNLVGVYIADVSGHGASSAFITILLKSIISKYLVHFRAHQDETVVQPDKLLQALSNEIFAAKLGKYITMIYGVLDTHSGEFAYGVGGHYPHPMLCSQDGSAKLLPGSGLPIGVLSEAQYVAQYCKILPGERLVLFTDGIMETFLPGKDLEQKEQGLLAAVQTSKADLPTLLRITSVTTSTNIAQPDDITILVVSHTSSQLS